MIAEQKLKQFEQPYASEQQSGYVYKTYDELLSGLGGQNYKNGFEPLQSLPATWYNSLMYLLTEQAQNTYLMIRSIYNELATVITEKVGDLDSTKTNQLLQAIEATATPLAATSEALGSIKLGFASTDTDRALLLNSEDRAYIQLKKAGSGQAGIVASNDTSWGVTYPASASGQGTVKTVTASGTTAGIVSSNDTSWGVNFTSGKGTVKTEASSTSTAGIVQLNDALNSTSTTQAATANAARVAYARGSEAYNMANSAIGSINDESTMRANNDITGASLSVSGSTLYLTLTRASGNITASCTLPTANVQDAVAKMVGESNLRLLSDSTYGIFLQVTDTEGENHIDSLKDIHIKSATFNVS